MPRHHAHGRFSSAAGYELWSVSTENITATIPKSQLTPMDVWGLQSRIPSGQQCMLWPTLASSTGLTHGASVVAVRCRPFLIVTCSLEEGAVLEGGLQRYNDGRNRQIPLKTRAMCQLIGHGTARWHAAGTSPWWSCRCTVTGH